MKEVVILDVVFTIYSKTVIFKRNGKMFGWHLNKDVDLYKIDLSVIGWPARQIVDNRIIKYRSGNEA